MEQKVISFPDQTNQFDHINVVTLAESECDFLIALAVEALKLRFKPGASLTSPGEVREYLQLKYAQTEHEIFSAIFLDQRHRVICFEELFHGTIDGASVHPREVVKKALQHNAAAVIFSHNHPSGVVEPSKSDERITERLKTALALIDIRVLDHVIVGMEGTVSFAERGLM